MLSVTMCIEYDLIVTPCLTASCLACHCSTDMATMENLWLKYSNGKFGYSVQKDVWRRAKGDFENFCRRVGWTTTDSEVREKTEWALV